MKSNQIQSFLYQYDRRQRKAKRILRARAYLEYISAFIVGLILFVLMSIDYN